MFNRMSRVLVTGGAQFIGANLVRTLLADGTDVSVLDDLSTGRPDYLDGLPVDPVRGRYWIHAWCDGPLGGRT
jgi:nucleoside-diphosphate-sugar epimerase